MRERFCQATRCEHAPTFDQGRPRRLNRGHTLVSRLACTGIRANSFRAAAGGLDSGAYWLSISPAAARWAHADPREPTDSLL